MEIFGGPPGYRCTVEVDFTMPLYGTKYALYSVVLRLLVFPYYEKQKPLKIRFKGHIKGRKKNRL